MRLVSRLRLHDKEGSPIAQARIRAEARRETRRLIAELARDRPDAWVTYHSYYKAPDLIGPAVCAALDLPYVQIEATRAKSRLNGPWAGFAAEAEAACDAACCIFYLTANDLITLDRHRRPGQMLVHLRPFLPDRALPPASTGRGAMLTAGMMRPGDKLASYRILAEALACLDRGETAQGASSDASSPPPPDWRPDWRLEIAGDGPARDAVAALMAPFGGRVRLLGQLDRAGLAAAYGRASLFLWPGVNEAYGMVYLEAQAAGLPVVAQDRPGMRDVLAQPGTAPEAGAPALARRIARLLADPALRRAEAARARAHVARHHLAGAATETLIAGLARALEMRR